MTPAIRTLGALALAGALGGCAVDGSTGEVKGPIFVGKVVAYGATHSKVAPQPPEWDAVCAQSFAVELPQGPLKADGVVVPYPHGVSIARALGRGGASYVEVMLSPAKAAEWRALFPQAGRYRLRRSDDSAGCTAALEGVIKAWQRGDEALRKMAPGCLKAERTGEPQALPDRAEDQARLFDAPYWTRPTAAQRELQGGAFKISEYGEELVDGRTGQVAARWRNWAVLQFQPPDQDHVYWGQIRDCGPNGGMRRQGSILDHRIFTSRAG